MPEAVQAKILDAAIRAPSGGNSQSWRFILVDSADIKARLGPLYRECADLLWAGSYAEQIRRARADPDDPASVAVLRGTRSAQHLVEHFESVPLYLFAFSRNDPSGGSIFPAGTADGSGQAVAASY